MHAASLGERRACSLSATESPLPPPFFLRLVLVLGWRFVGWRGVGNVVLQRPDRGRRRAWRVLGVGRRGVDLIGQGAEAVGFADKTGLVMLHAFRLGTLTPLATAAAAPAATAAAALAFAILAGPGLLGILLAIAVRSRRFRHLGGFGGFADAGIALGVGAFATLATTATSATAPAAATALAAF